MLRPKCQLVFVVTHAPYFVIDGLTIDFLIMTDSNSWPKQINQPQLSILYIVYTLLLIEPFHLNLRL